MILLLGLDTAMAGRFDACNSSNRSCRKACYDVANTILEQGGGTSFDLDACLNVCAVNQNRCTKVPVSGLSVTGPKKVPTKNLDITPTEPVGNQ